jgi:hypothetical protein
VSGEALAATNGGAIVVAFFIQEKSFRRGVRSSTRDSRRGWALLKRNRPVELESEHLEWWFSPSSFR